MHYGVLGAGLIGTYIGGRLALAGRRVTLVGRAAWADQMRAQGCRVEVAEEGADYEGTPVEIAADSRSLAACDVVLVAVKATQTAEAARQLAETLPQGLPVVSLQNGVRNRGLLQGALGSERVHAGMVAFNVVDEGVGRVRRTTSGPIRISGPAVLAADLGAAGLDAAVDADMEAVLWGKLLFNLNNAVIALVDRSIGESILDPDCRWLYRQSMREGLAACRAAGVRVKGFGRLRPSVSAWLMGLPEPILRALRGAIVRADPRSRSSMWQDLERGRRTEVDLLNGEVAALARSAGLRAPVNQFLVECIHQAEASGQRPRLDPAWIRRQVDLAGG